MDLSGMPVDEGRCSLTCACWDCHAWRRHLLRRAGAVVLMVASLAAWF